MKRSPISLVGNVSTPTMVITGEEDYRTPISESEQYTRPLNYAKWRRCLRRYPVNPTESANAPAIKSPASLQP